MMRRRPHVNSVLKIFTEFRYSESTGYSDWVPDGGETLQPPKRQSQRQVKRKRWSSEEPSGKSHDSTDEDEKWTSSVASRKKRPSPPARLPSPRRKVTRREKQVD